jgi:adenylylsulfate kinase-like enzyme
VRRQIQQAGQPGDFIEIFVDTPLDVCQARDPKGLYEKVRRGELKNFTGIDSPYEPPVEPEITLRTAEASVPQLATNVIDYLVGCGKLRTS